MLIRIVLSIYGFTFFVGCTHPEEESVESNPPLPSQSTEISNSSGTVSFLKNEDNVTDYRAMHTYLPPEDSNWIEFGTFRSPKPSTWQWDTPNSTFVTNNYVVPGVQDGDSGAFTISQFLPDKGGTLSQNIKRWVSKFNTNEGAPVKPKIDVMMVNGIESDVVEIRGEYMGAGGAWHLPDRTLVVVIFRDSSGVYFFKLLGPTKTIRAHRDSMFNLLNKIEQKVP